MKSLKTVFTLTIIGITLPLGGVLIELNITGEPLDYDFAPLPHFPDENEISIIITYETTAPIDSIFSTLAFRKNAIEKISVRSGSYNSSFVGPTGLIVLHNNTTSDVNPFDRITLEMASRSDLYPDIPNLDINPVTLEPHSGGGEFESLFLEFASASADLYKSHDLPTEYDLLDYSLGNLAFIRFSDGSVWFNITSTSTTTIPELSTGLFLLTLTLYAALHRRR